MFVACVLTKKKTCSIIQKSIRASSVYKTKIILYLTVLFLTNSLEMNSLFYRIADGWLLKKLTVQTCHIRYEANPTGNEPPLLDTLEIHGKTPYSKIPIPLIEKMKSLVSKEDFHRLFLRADKPNSIVDVWIFGEGYGKNIQKFDNDYISNGVNFIVFDIKIGNIWLTRESVEDICKQLNLNVVTLVGYMRLFEAIEYVAKGFKSAVAENKDLNAEGLVLTAPLGMRDRLGNRIITKIKTCDFVKLNDRLKSIK